MLLMVMLSAAVLAGEAKAPDAAAPAAGDASEALEAFRQARTSTQTTNRQLQTSLFLAFCQGARLRRAHFPLFLPWIFSRRLEIG